MGKFFKELREVDKAQIPPERLARIQTRRLQAIRLLSRVTLCNLALGVGAHSFMPEQQDQITYVSSAPDTRPTEEPSIDVSRLRSLNGEPVDRTGLLLDYLHNERDMPLKNATFLAANFIAESRLDPLAQGDSNTAIGIGQWRGVRQDGLPLAGAPDDLVIEQARFALDVDMPRDFKTKNTYMLLWDPNATDEELKTFMLGYERPDMEMEVVNGYPRFRFAAQLLEMVQPS